MAGQCQNDDDHFPTVITMSIHPQLQQAFQEGCALKIIAGLTNFDRDRVAQVVRAADRGGGQFS